MVELMDLGGGSLKDLQSSFQGVVDRDNYLYEDTGLLGG